ncbi:MAG: DUF4255 domain-containing protein [Chloroflexi bacterium]|nr:DUF4255 domain-containing protein [Chloroflexota bacterium]
MFADLDETIRQLLIQRGSLDSGEVDIAFEATTRDWAAGISKPTVNLYLYQILENLELKDPSGWQVRRGNNNTAIKSRPLVRVDLTYMVTAWANAIEDEHRLLSRVILTLLQYPVLPEELLVGTVAGQEIRTFTAQPNGIKSPADYWGAMDQDIKASFEFKATVAMDLSQEITVGLVLTRRLRVGELENGKLGIPMQDLSHQIGGRVYSGGDPNSGVSGASVTLLERALDTTTDEEGRYSFAGVPPGTYTLVINAPDTAEHRREIQVPDGSYDTGI